MNRKKHGAKNNVIVRNVFCDEKSIRPLGSRFFGLLWLPQNDGRGRVVAIVLSLFLLAAPLFAEPHAFPNPFVPSKGDTNVTFTDLPGSGSIKIYTPDGNLVTELTMAPGVILMGWNVTNSSGKKLASGVYFCVVEGNGTTTRIKLVVVR